MAKKGGVPEWMDEDDLFDDDDVVEGEGAPKGKPVLSRGGARKSEPEGAGAAREKPASGKPDDDDSEDGEKGPSFAARLALKHAKRPGEQEVLKSPLVLTLGGGALFLAIAAGAFYFIIGRDTVTRRMQAIEGSIGEQRFTQAIAELDAFLLDHPRDKYTESATLLRAKTRIDKEVTGSVPNWPKGAEAVQSYIDECRDFDTFGEQYPMLAEVAGNIAVGALKTAGETKDRSLLEVSEKGKTFLDRFSDPENPPTKKHEEIKLALQAAEASIRKYEVTQATYKEIDDALARKKTIEALESRRRLINKYKDLATDSKLAAYMTKTLETERGLVHVEKIDPTATSAERELPVPAPLTLTLHTRARTDESASGRTIFAIAQGCCYGLDTVTGDPVWRRSIGMDSPFFPLVVETTVPGVLVFDTVYQELVLLNRLNGTLVWRLALAEPVSGEPLVHGGQIFLPTLGNHLYRIDLQSGAATTRLTFSQPVYAPPVLTRDELHLIVAGDQAMMYTLDVRSLECQQVSFTDQKPGSIDVPMLQMGDLVLMIENDQSGGAARSVLRVLDTTKCTEKITERSAVRLAGIVRDRPVLRGNRLFVAAEGEQFNVFTVSDDPEKTPLSPIAQPPGQTEYSGPVELAAGADDILWKSSDFLRRYQLTQDALQLDQDRKFEVGATALPLQTIGATLFVGRQRMESDAVSMLLINGETLASEWETVVGAGVLKFLPIREDSVLALTKSGEVFQVTASNLEAGGFRFQPDGLVEVPINLAAPLRACTLPSRQIAVARGGDKPHFWLINQAGKIAMETPLDEAPVGDPVPMADGAVFPLASKLRLLGLRTRVEDYLGTVEQNESVQWAHLVPLDNDHMIVVDVKGRVSRVQFRKTPTFHMQQVDSLDLGNPVDVAPLVVGTQLVLTDASGQIRLLNSANFESLVQAKLDVPAVGKLAVAGKNVLVETARGQLQALAIDNNLSRVWEIDLKNDHLSGDPLADGERIIFGTMTGRVLVLNAASGAVENSVQLDQPIEHGPLRIGSSLVVATIDGSLYRIESVLGGGQ